jgi:hypothetical protein
MAGMEIVLEDNKLQKHYGRGDQIEFSTLFLDIYTFVLAPGQVWG